MMSIRRGERENPTLSYAGMASWLECTETRSTPAFDCGFQHKSGELTADTYIPVFREYEDRL